MADFMTCRLIIETDWDERCYYLNRVSFWTRWDRYCERAQARNLLKV